MPNRDAVVEEEPIFDLTTPQSRNEAILLDILDKVSQILEAVSGGGGEGGK